MFRTKPFNWQVPKDVNEHNDQLLTCLELLTKYYQCPRSRQTLIANLPLLDNKLTPALFSKAAKRAQLDSQIHELPLDEINSAVLPAVLLLKDGHVALLFEKNDDYARILLMETGRGINSIPISQLKAQYAGIAIFVKPKYRFNYQSDKLLQEDSKNWLWHAFKEVWPVYTEILLASFLINLFALAVPLFIMNVYDRVVPNLAFNTLWVLAIGVGIVFLFDFTLRQLRGYFIDIAGKKIDVTLSAKIFYKIMGIKMDHRPPSTGAFSNIVQSFEVFRDFITSTTMTVLVDLPFLSIYLLIIYFIGGNMALIPLAMLPVVIIVGVLLQLPLIRLTKKSYLYGSEKNATLIESLAGIESIKIYGAEGHMQSRWEQVAIENAKIGNKLRVISNFSVNFTLLCQQLVTIFIVIFGVYKIGQGELTVGGLIACTILSGRAIAPMAQLSSILVRYFQSVNSLKAINHIMALPTDFNIKKDYLHRPNLKGSIEFKELSFKYNEHTPEILKSISFKIKQGEKVAIMGSIGSGKSTIAKLIMGLYQPNKGSIYIGEVDQNQINPADLRHQIGHVSQDVLLFNGSIKDNISFGASYKSDQDILNAAKIAGVDTFIASHPDGYDLQVGEQGKQLSQGQRQSVGLARALLLEPDIYVLDEPFASADLITENQICHALKHFLNEQKTLLLFTHKLNLLQLVDRIMIIDKGKIILDGPKDKVLLKLRRLQHKQQEQVNNEKN